MYIIYIDVYNVYIMYIYMAFLNTMANFRNSTNILAEHSINHIESKKKQEKSFIKNL